MLEVRVRGAERALEVTFAASGSDKEERFRYPAEYLRVYSPAAAPHHAHNSVNDPPVLVAYPRAFVADHEYDYIDQCFPAACGWA